MREGSQISTVQEFDDMVNQCLQIFWRSLPEGNVQLDLSFSLSVDRGEWGLKLANQFWWQSVSMTTTVRAVQKPKLADLVCVCMWCLSDVHCNVLDPIISICHCTNYANSDSDRMWIWIFRCRKMFETKRTEERCCIPAADISMWSWASCIYICRRWGHFICWRKFFEPPSLEKSAWFEVQCCFLLLSLFDWLPSEYSRAVHARMTCPGSIFRFTDFL